MSYPPPFNGQYPPPYLHQPLQHPSHNPPPPPPQQQQQPQYINPNATYQQYGKPPAYFHIQPQPAFPPFSHQQQHLTPQVLQQHPPQQQHHPSPPPLQYVNPAQTTFSPSPVHGSPFNHGPTPPSPVSSHHVQQPLAPSPSLAPMSGSPSYFAGPNSTQPDNSYGQFISPAPPRPQLPTPAPVPSPRLVNQSHRVDTPPSIPRQSPASISASLPISAQPPASPVPPSTPAIQVVVPSAIMKQTPEIKKEQTAQQPQPSLAAPAPKSQSQPIPEKPLKTSDQLGLLLALADEYLNAAHAHTTELSLHKKEVHLEQYFKLVATGLTCLEAVLKGYRLEPTTEAAVRLRWARVLFEETSNDLEAETALSKGIDLCDRNGLNDLKYSMQLLLGRVLFKTQPKAALKHMDRVMQEVETYGHVPWQYAFRFLRVSLALSSASHQEFVVAVQNLHKISNLANKHGDKVVAIVSAVLESLAQIQLSTDSDSIEQAQRALAVARSHQLDDVFHEIPQLSAMMQIADISCSLLECDVNQSTQKLEIMQEFMDRRINDSCWRPDGTFSIPISGKPFGSSSSNPGDIFRVEGGKLSLTLSWLPLQDLYVLCYFLSSLTLSTKNSYDGHKAEKYLYEGISMVKGSFTQPQETKESLSSAGKRIEWRKTLHCNLLVHRIFLASARSDWELASQTLEELRQKSNELGQSFPDTTQCLMQYASGVIAQGTGDITGALAAFESPILALSPSTSKSRRNDPRRDTAILAALNTILILREPSHPSHSRLSQIMSMVEPFCQSSQNRYIQAAFYLVCATVQTDSTIQTKQHLQQALQSATAINNSQIICITLTFMSWKYFRGVVGQQSEKSAKAGRAVAKKANDALWVSVTDEMLAETLDRQGKVDDARAVREEALRVMMGLPAPLKHMSTH